MAGGLGLLQELEPVEGVGCPAGSAGRGACQPRAQAAISPLLRQRRQAGTQAGPSRLLRAGKQAAEDAGAAACSAHWSGAQWTQAAVLTGGAPSRRNRPVACARRPGCGGSKKGKRLGS